jgi:AcrR family transcriptional regulator
MDENSGVMERREALRAAVLAAAEARVARSGLADLGVREIAREAGCSSGMVYKLFANHDELVLSVNARTLAALGEAMAGRLHDVDDPAGAVCAMADAYLDFASANTPRWDALFAHRMAGGAALPQWYAKQRDHLFDSLAATIDAASPALPGAISGDAFARTLFSAVHGVVALGLQQKVGVVSPDALRAELQALIKVITSGTFRSAVR